MTEPKRYMCYYDDNRDSSDRVDVDTIICSDDEDFEKLSIPCSEPVSEDEAVVDATSNERTVNSADKKLSPETAQFVPFSFKVLKPPSPTMQTASVPSVHTEVSWQCPASDRVERPPLRHELLTLANDIDKLMV